MNVNDTCVQPAYPTLPKDNKYEKAKEILEKLLPYPDFIDEEMIRGMQRMIENPDDPKLIFKRTYLLLKYYLDGDSLSLELNGRIREWLVAPENRDIKEKALQTIFMENYLERHGRAGKLLGSEDRIRELSMPAEID